MSTALIEREREEPFLLYLLYKALHPNVTQRDDGSPTALPERMRGANRQTGPPAPL